MMKPWNCRWRAGIRVVLVPVQVLKLKYRYDPGSKPQKGIAGFGETVEVALRDFDAKYLRALEPPEVPAIKK